MKKEYDFTGAVRGKYFARYQRMKLKILLDPDVAKEFPDSKAVNDALRRLTGTGREVRRGSGRGKVARRRKAG